MELYITKTGTAFKTESIPHMYEPHVLTHPFYKAGAKGVSALVNRLHYQAPLYMQDLAREEMKKLVRYHRMSPFQRGQYNEYSMYLHCVENNKEYLGPYA